jgi:cell division FtsZ-interacting protein ZapD
MEKLMNILMVFEQTQVKTMDLKNSILQRIWTKNTTLSSKNDIDVEVDFLCDRMSKLTSDLTLEHKIYELKVKQAKSKKNSVGFNFLQETSKKQDYRPRQSILE